MRVAIGDFPSIRRIHRPRRDRKLRRRIHVVPPADVRAGKTRIDLLRRIPDFLRRHELVRLLPEFDLALVAEIPAVADDAVLAGLFAGQIRRLTRAGDGGDGRIDTRHAPGLAKHLEARSELADERWGEPDDVDDNGFLHTCSTGF